MDMGKEIIKTMGYKLLLDAFHSSLVASVYIPKFETTVY
jgi:hypothetical protein